jgi:NAD(P)-dependent dehydrogenase (short-subunit alcohol dehydrogenase family)
MVKGETVMRFADKVVLITGGGSGLGAEMATAFAAEGAVIVLNDIHAEKAEQTANQIIQSGGMAAFVGGDVGCVQDVENIVDQAVQTFGGIDILVNNAGIADTITPTEEQDVDQWQRIVDIHLRGSYLCSKIAGKTMIRNRYGKIINISSIAGVVGLPKRNAYSSAKAGMVMFTRVLASEWAKYRINVNAVAPGYILTPLLKELLSSEKVTEEKIRKRIPLGHMGEPGDIAHAVMFLASDEAKYITGVCLPVDGGWSAFGDSGDAFSFEE